MGIKLIMVGALAILMTIPALFVFLLISDRSERAAKVSAEVGQSVGGPQIFLGPVLVVPSQFPATVDDKHKPVPARDAGYKVFFPSIAEADVSVKTEVRHRSLFQVPVYQAELNLKSSFDLADANSVAPAGAVFDWTKATFVVGAADARGALADPTLQDGETVSLMAPIQQFQADLKKPDAVPSYLKTFGVTASPAVHPGAVFNVTAKLKFSGAQRLAILAYGKSTHVDVKANWADPSFDGDFLPVKSLITDHDFQANWAVPYVARGVPSAGDLDLIGQLRDTEMGVTFAILADPYQSVTRSVKYAILFLVLVFLTYFIFEVSSGTRVHPAQYILVGVAQIVFYLLLLAFAERIGFDFGFLIAAIATVGLISIYAGWVFNSRRRGVQAFVVFSLLYGLIYILLRLEDQALLLGSIAAFTAIAAVMYVTRRIDWYGGSATPGTPPVA